MNTSIDRRVARAIKLMERRRTEPPGLADLAQAVGLSRSRLTALFVEETGLPPMRYDRIRRLDHAYERLTSTFLDLDDIMVTVGWRRYRPFARSFRQRFGIDPRDLRTKAHEERRTHFRERRYLGADLDL